MKQNEAFRQDPEPQKPKIHSGMKTGSASPFLQRIFSKTIYRIMIGAATGAIAGLLYWEFIGCNGGSCPITSNPYKTVIIFTLIGGMMARR
jgi:hypothetical protein